MAALQMAVSVLSVLVKMIQQIREGIDEGVSDEEIRNRLANPNGVAQEILDAVRERKSQFDNPFIKDPA